MKESVRILRFMVVGSMNAIIMALVVWFVMRELHFEDDYMVANITAYIVAQIHNFLWCKYWIFPKTNRKNSIWQQILFFCSAFAVAYISQFLFLILLVEVLGVNEYLAQFLGLFIYGAVNFMSNKKITFQ
jgi:putative flippase GtrA